MTDPVTKTQAEAVVPIVTRFIGACSPEQIRLAPDKCMRIWDMRFEYSVLLKSLLIDQGFWIVVTFMLELWDVAA